MPHKKDHDLLVYPALAIQVLAKVGNDFDRIRTDTKVIVLQHPTCGESVHLCSEFKIYSSNRVHGIGQVTIWSHN